MVCGMCYDKFCTSTDSNNVTGTIQQLEKDSKGIERELDKAGAGVADAQDTTARIERITESSRQLLDRLQAELDEIAEANGIPTEGKEKTKNAT